MSFSSCLHAHVEQKCVFEMPCESGNEMNLGFLAQSRSWKVDWSHSESSWYTFDFDARLVSCVKASVDPGQNR